MLKNNKQSFAKRGTLNPQWKGDDVGYGKLHSWVIKRIPKPEICPMCKERKVFDLSNKGIYNRDLNNWEWLCRRCHMESDGRLDKFLLTKKSFKKGNQFFKLRDDLKGEEHPCSKITSENVIDMRKKFHSGGFTLKYLANKYGVSLQNVSSIVNNKTWKHIK